MINYVPQPGTLPSRVVAHLQTLPAGTEVASAVLADSIDADTRGFASCLEYAVMHGALVRNKREGRVYWSLGDGKPRGALLEHSADDEPVITASSRPRHRRWTIRCPSAVHGCLAPTLLKKFQQIPLDRPRLRPRYAPSRPRQQPPCPGRCASRCGRMVSW